MVKYEVTADFELQLSPRPSMSREPALEALNQDDRERYLRDEATIPVESDSVQKVIQEIPMMRRRARSGCNGSLTTARSRFRGGRRARRRGRGTWQPPGVAVGLGTSDDGPVPRDRCSGPVSDWL